MATVQVRYIVNDVDAAIAFYCQNLGFTEVMHPAPAFVDGFPKPRKNGGIGKWTTCCGSH